MTLNRKRRGNDMAKNTAFYARKARNSRREEKRKKHMAKHVARTKQVTETAVAEPVEGGAE